MSIKDKLRKQTKEAHHDFRQELYSDIKKLYHSWYKHAKQLEETTDELRLQSEKSMKKNAQLFRDYHQETNDAIEQLSYELARLKRRKSWEFALATIFVAIICTVTIFFLMLNHYGLL